jgi:hypothetical protein
MPAPTPNDPSHRATPATPPTHPPHWLDTFFKYAAPIAVDHTHLLPLDRIAGRTGNVAPTERSRCRC